MDTFTPSQAPEVYKISVPIGGGFLCPAGAEAENSAVKFSKESVPPLCMKIGLPNNNNNNNNNKKQQRQK